MQARPHISLEVSDLNKSIHFYSRVFRMAPTKTREDYANYRVESPGLHLALEHRPNRICGNPFPNQHFGIELFAHDDLMEWRNWLQAVGINYLVEEQVTCCYAVADKFWLTDPDGHRWEFWVRTDEADLMHGETASAPHASSSECSALTIQATEGKGETNVLGDVPVHASAQSISNATTNDKMSSSASGCCG